MVHQQSNQHRVLYVGDLSETLRDDGRGMAISTRYKRQQSTNPNPKIHKITLHSDTNVVSVEKALL
jgi:hypothetical protein